MVARVAASKPFRSLRAIAEQPGAEMRCIGVIWGPDEGAAAAFEAVIAAPAVEQRFGQAAIQ